MEVPIQKISICGENLVNDKKTQLSEDYRILKKIGHGAYSEVFIA